MILHIFFYKLISGFELVFYCMFRNTHQNADFRRAQSFHAGVFIHFFSLRRQLADSFFQNAGVLTVLQAMAAVVCCNLPAGGKHLSSFGLGLLFSEMVIDRVSRNDKQPAFKIVYTGARINSRLHFFTIRTTKIWNSLPETVVCAKSVDSFRNSIRLIDFSKFLIL